MNLINDKFWKIIGWFKKRKEISGQFISNNTIWTLYFKRGDKGTQVKNLQKFLNWFGNYKLAVDGSYGPKTEAAQKKFQKACGLKQDGMFGEASLSKAKRVRK